MLVDVQNYDVRRIAAIYADSLGLRWWTKISRDMAVKFVQGAISKDDWLMRYYPKQMSACQKAIEQARKLMLGL